HARAVGATAEEADAQYLLASAYRQLRRFGEAREYANHVLALEGRGASPGYVASAWVEIGLADLEEGRSNEAEQAFKRASSVAGANASVAALIWVCESKLEGQRGHNDRALRLLRMARSFYASTGMKSAFVQETERFYIRCNDVVPRCSP